MRSASAVLVLSNNLASNRGKAMNASGLKKWQKRLLSGIVLGPLIIAVTWKGGPMFAALMTAAAIVCLYEWFELARRSKYAILVSLLGFVYIIFSFWICYKLREHHSVKIALLFLTMVWASDIGAYITGKSIGGAKMTPTISPNKTWSGLIGAMIAPALAGAVYILAYDYVYDVARGRDMFELFLSFIAFGALIGLVGQAGDLLVSMLKRHVSVKDASQLIPGHGGLLDRVDAMMLSAPVYLFVISRILHDVAS
jgi:phosphatidate cytidylyltransferase